MAGGRRGSGRARPSEAGGRTGRRQGPHGRAPPVEGTQPNGRLGGLRVAHAGAGRGCGLREGRPVRCTCSQASPGDPPPSQPPAPGGAGRAGRKTGQGPHGLSRGRQRGYRRAGADPPDARPPSGRPSHPAGPSRPPDPWRPDGRPAPVAWVRGRQDPTCHGEAAGFPGGRPTGRGGLEARGGGTWNGAAARVRLHPGAVPRPGRRPPREGGSGRPEARTRRLALGAAIRGPMPWALRSATPPPGPGEHARGPGPPGAPPREGRAPGGMGGENTARRRGWPKAHAFDWQAASRASLRFASGCPFRRPP